MTTLNSKIQLALQNGIKLDKSTKTEAVASSERQHTRTKKPLTHQKQRTALKPKNRTKENS